MTAAAGDEAGGPARLALEGAPGVVTPPEGEWKQRSGQPAAGQWFTEFRGADEALLRVHVFPALQTARPEQVLVQAVDLFFRGLGVQGFGLPTRRTFEVWGCPAAEGSMFAMRGATRVKGRARLLRVSVHQWACALGIAPADAPLSSHDAVHAFVGSLEPLTPRFYERRFHRAVEHDVVVVRKAGEEPVTVGHLAAVEVLLEAGIGARFPLALRPQVRQTLQADAFQGPPATRTGFRETAAALQQALELEPAERTRTLQAMGRRILEAILARAEEGYTPAMRFAFAWREMRRLSVGQAENGLTTGDVAHLAEMSAFLASIAADREVVADGAARKRLHGRLVTRWPKLASADRKALRAAGDTWAALRYAWDQATADRRLVFRAAAAVRLSPPADQPTVLAEPPDPRALKRWLDARPREGLDAALLDAAFGLEPAALRALLDTLGVEDAFEPHFGW